MLKSEAKRTLLLPRRYGGGHFFLRRHYPDQVNGYILSSI